MNISESSSALASLLAIINVNMTIAMISAPCCRCINEKMMPRMMSDKGARDHITLPFLIMYGFTGNRNDFLFSAQN